VRRFNHSDRIKEIVRAREDQMVNEAFAMIANYNKGREEEKYDMVKVIMDLGLNFDQALEKCGLTKSRYYEIEKDIVLRDSKND
jgi:hypothetical protein